MKSTFVPLIYKCNDNCISCPVPNFSKRKTPSFDELRKKIDRVLKYSNHIEFNGGEPTLRKDLLKILQYTQNKSPREITLLTNSQMLCYENYVKKLSKIKNLKVITTIYGHDNRLHDSITRTPQSFEKKVAGIKNIIKYNIKVELRILLHRVNYKYFNEIASFIIKNFNKNNLLKIIIMNPKLTFNAKKYKNIVMEKISNIAKNLEEPILNLVKKGFIIELYHFPHCILPKILWKYSSGVTAGSTEIIFPIFCADCIKKEECSGIWRSYYKLSKIKEFFPIKND